MVEEEPEYGDAQLMTWNPHAGRTSRGWDDYSRLQNEDLARRKRANVAALQEEQRQRLDQQVEINQRPNGKALDNFWSCATGACWATTAFFVLMLAAIIVVPITNWSGDITTSSNPNELGMPTGYTLSANINKTHSAGDACSNIDPPNRLSEHGVLTLYRRAEKSMGTTGEGLQSVAACEEFFHLLSVESKTGRAEAPHQPSRAVTFSGDQQRLDITKEEMESRRPRPRPSPSPFIARPRAPPASPRARRR